MAQQWCGDMRPEGGGGSGGAASANAAGEVHQQPYPPVPASSAMAGLALGALRAGRLQRAAATAACSAGALGSLLLGPSCCRTKGRWPYQVKSCRRLLRCAAQLHGPINGRLRDWVAAARSTAQFLELIGR